MSVSMMCSSLAFVLVLHTCTRKLHRTGWSRSLLGLAARVDSHLVPAEFGDHRADVLLELAEFVERVPFVGLTDEACPADERMVVSADADEACTLPTRAAGVVVDAFGHRVNGNDVAGELPQRVSGETSVKFGRVVDEDGGDFLKVFALTDANQRAVSLHATDHRTRFGGLWPQLESGFEFGRRQGWERILGLGHAPDRPE